MKTLIRHELNRRVSRECGIPCRWSKNDIARKVIDCTLQQIFEHLSTGGIVCLRGFGTFKLKTRKAMVGRCPTNPSDTYDIPAHKEVVFVPSAALFKKVVMLPLDL